MNRQAAGVARLARWRRLGVVDRLASRRAAMMQRSPDGASLGQVLLNSWSGWLPCQGRGRALDRRIALELSGLPRLLQWRSYRASGRPADARSSCFQALKGAWLASISRRICTRALMAKGGGRRTGGYRHARAVVAGVRRGEVIEAPLVQSEVAAVDGAPPMACPCQPGLVVLCVMMLAPCSKGRRDGAWQGIVDHDDMLYASDRRTSRKGKTLMSGCPASRCR